MELGDLLGLLGGLALFMHGMQLMSAGLEAAAGSRMKEILERLTANRLLGVAVGAAITAVIQSSSATTVMVVGFVNAGMMTLNQAVWIIMGANIGTTSTGLLIALDVGVLAPLFAFAGIVLSVFVKDARARHIGQILLGLGILFIGMNTMSDAMRPLRDSQLFLDLVGNFSNPLLGIAFGTVFTAIIQSSSAAVGILQSLAGAGVIPFSSAVYVLFGTNIGTCVTAVLSALGTGRNARRATAIHLLFNVIGTVLFTLLVLVFPVTALIQSLTAEPKAQIAAMHAAFNLVTTALLLPFGGALARLAAALLPDRPQPAEDRGMHLEFLRPDLWEGGLGVSAIVIDQLRSELNRMLDFARENVEESFRAVLERDVSRLDRVEEREEYIDYLNREISRHASRLIPLETGEDGSAVVSSYFTISGNIERIGDHADNLAGYTRLLTQKGFDFSAAARGEITAMGALCARALQALREERAGREDWLGEVERLEQQFDDMTADCRRSQLERLRGGGCSEEACIIYSELLTDFERIGDHVLNIAQELTQARTAL